MPNPPAVDIGGIYPVIGPFDKDPGVLGIDRSVSCFGVSIYHHDGIRAACPPRRASIPGRGILAPGGLLCVLPVRVSPGPGKYKGIDNTAGGKQYGDGPDDYAAVLFFSWECSFQTAWAVL